MTIRWIEVVTVGVLALAAGAAAAQTAPEAPLKPIGVTSRAPAQAIPSLFVLNARGAQMQNGSLTLTGVSPDVILFADRPVRAAGHAPTADLVKEWSGNDTFAKDPPNATISVFDKDGAKVKDAVVTLTSPKANGADLVFAVKVLEGDLTGADGPAALFIDRFGAGGGAFRFSGGGFDHASFYRAGGDDRWGGADRDVSYDRTGTYDRYGAYGHYGAYGDAYHPYPYGAGAVGAAAVGTAALAGAAAGSYWGGAYNPYYSSGYGYYPPPPAPTPAGQCGLPPYPPC